MDTAPQFRVTPLDAAEKEPMPNRAKLVLAMLLFAAFTPFLAVSYLLEILAAIFILPVKAILAINGLITGRGQDKPDALAVAIMKAMQENQGRVRVEHEQAEVAIALEKEPELEHNCHITGSPRFCDRCIGVREAKRSAKK